MAQYVKKSYAGPELPPPAECLFQMANGLQHVHRRWIHRDIKPENILITNPPVKLKISDFCSSKSISELGEASLSDIAQNDAEWLAPEILLQIGKNKPYDPISIDSDIFSLGCVFGFFLSRGIHPFGNKNEIRYNIVRGTSNLGN